jgi:hypothetical protein
MRKVLTNMSGTYNAPDEATLITPLGQRASCCCRLSRPPWIVLCWASWFTPGRQVDHPPAGPLPQRPPARRRAGPRRASSLPRSRRRPHHLDIPNLRCDGVRAATQHPLHDTQATGGRPHLQRLRCSRRHPSSARHPAWVAGQLIPAHSTYMCNTSPMYLLVPPVPGL